MKLEEIQNQIWRSRLRWFGHVTTLNEHRILERLLEMKVSGTRSRGRPYT